MYESARNAESRYESCGASAGGESEMKEVKQRKAKVCRREIEWVRRLGFNGQGIPIYPHLRLLLKSGRLVNLGSRVDEMVGVSTLIGPCWRQRVRVMEHA